MKQGFKHFDSNYENNDEHNLIRTDFAPCADQELTSLISLTNSPTSLSRSLVVVCGGLHSTLCFLQSSFRNLFVSSESKSGGNLIPSA